MKDSATKMTNSSTPTGCTGYTPVTGCHHIRLVNSYRQSNWLDCGIYIPKKKINTLREHEGAAYISEIPLDNVLDWMISKMHINRPYSPKPNYLRYRRFVVDWMWEIGDTIRLSYATIHHSVALMDTYFSKVSDINCDKSSKEFLQLIALTSIYISAKFREKDSRGPTAENISTMTKGQYTREQILDWERLLLKAIGWELHFSTPADFVTLFLNQGLVFNDDEIFKGKRSSQTEPPSLKIVQYVRKFAEFLWDLWLQEYEFQKYDSHTLACSILLASRRSVHFKKTWNEEFEYLFNVTLDDVHTCYKNVYKFYMDSFPSKEEPRTKHHKSKHDSDKTNKSQKHGTLSNRSSSNTFNQRSNSISTILAWNQPTSTKIVSQTRNKLSSTTRANYKTSVPRVVSSKVSIAKLSQNSSTNLKNTTITTPNKQIVSYAETGSGNAAQADTTYYKSGSSNKRSSIKNYKPEVIQHRAPRPAFYDSNQRYPKVTERKNRVVNSRIQTKLDFGDAQSHSRSRKTIQPWTSSYKQMYRSNTSTISNENKENIKTYSNIDNTIEKINQKITLRKNLNQGMKSNLKLKISKNKINTNFDSNQGLSRAKHGINTKSRNFSRQRIDSNLKSVANTSYEVLSKQRSMVGMNRMPSNFR